MSPHTLFLTVGTSLLGALRRTEPPLAPEPLREALARATSPDTAVAGARALGQLLAQGGWDERQVGAEIASVQAMERGGHLPGPLHEVCLAVSDTDDGRLVGAVLAAWAEARGWRARLEVIDGLRPTEPATFARVGLRGLVRAVGEAVRRAGGGEFVAVVATGGFKAQVATVAIAGQALGLTVYNLHELFPHVIAFPPMAVSFDFAPLLTHLDLVMALEEEGVAQLPEGAVPPALEPFLAHVLADQPGQALWELAPIGQIYLEAFRHRFPPSRELPPAAQDRKPPTFRDDHFPKGFREHAHRVWETTPQLVTGHTVTFEGQASIRDRAFYWHDGFLVGEYRDRDGFGARMAYTTTATHEGQRLALLAAVLDRWGRG
ncbi:MAG: putative CRISPR-associated protein [Candidatus Sericytochromatia bacterium]|nr:putative CRISPR-associated protein [Candidatus Sericytochromatia bacterium]